MLATPEIVRRALVVGSIVALVAAAAAGVLRIWIWILALEPLALGVVIGEAAAAPTSARHRWPPPWSYAYVFGIGFLAYLTVHLVFWLASSGFPPSVSLFAFLKAAPSATATPLFQSVDIPRQLALATGGATALKYFIWLVEGILSGCAAALAYRAGSVRMLRT
jgi:hypothetical protein